MEIGKRLKGLMTKRKVSNKELSTALDIPASTISQWINYDQTPGPEALLKISKFFHVSMEYLITGSEPEIDIAKKFIEGLDKEWISIHQGVYRIKIEKQID